ncbi:CDP-glycerol glycerophosphotransferase family protein [Exiguobacterium flavidum]|uniref:CDP-glycerol glycerophosphotransferase family protein n=1 Tax=Exiguobacterium flavidum TaxID=2184695 RepID=UPI001E56DAC3|nr:CDP-glycerol glycerophosphotransferase family protein [Exiguobacterium flavidum]
MTYGGNATPINRLLQQVHPEIERTLVYDPRFIKRPEEWGAKRFYSSRFRNVPVLAYLLATSNVTWFDNYVPLLSAAPRRKNARRIQLWHAAGALKEFGLTAQQNKVLPLEVKKRFQKVYKGYGDFVVPGMGCAKLFMPPHGLKESAFVPLGVPRTDYWFDEQHRENVVERLSEHLPPDKKILLYAPTYRENQTGLEEQAIRSLREALDPAEWTVVLKLHPTVEPFDIGEEGILFAEKGFSLNDYLLVTDVLITDYSSVPFEACLLGLPTFLYVPDLKDYTIFPGIIPDFPGPLPVRVTGEAQELTEWLRSEKVLEECGSRMRAFSEEWYDLPPGQATRRLVERYYSNSASK